MNAEIWVYGITLVVAGLLVWRFAMQYYTYLEDTCNQSEMARDRLKRYLGVDRIAVEPEPDSEPTPEPPAEGSS